MGSLRKMRASFLPLLLGAAFMTALLYSLSVDAPSVPLTEVRETASTVAFRSHAGAAVLYCAENGEVLWGENENAPLPMASTTKIMTALVVLENASPDEEVTIPREAVGIEGSSMYLREGEIYTVKELLYGLLLESGNDAAAALAVHVGGTQETFVGMMNDRAASLGLSSTHYANPHGLSAEGHGTTAKELAMVTAEALRLPLFREIFGTKSITLEKTEGHEARYLTNHNKLLWQDEACIGGKTGYTLLAGRCLVSVLDDICGTMIAVTLHDRSDWTDHKMLYQLAREHYRRVIVAEPGELSCPLYENGTTRTLSNRERVAVVLDKNDETPLGLTLLPAEGKGVLTADEHRYTFSIT